MISLFCAVAATKRRAKVARRRREAIAGQQLSAALGGWDAVACWAWPPCVLLCVALLSF